MTLLGIIASSISGNLTPTSPVAGYSLWLDASDTAKITVSGNSVTQWQDKANNYNFTQATSAKQPQSGTRTINSKNVIDFDGGDGLVGTMAASVWKFTTDGDASFFAVALRDSGGGRFATNNSQGSPGVGFFWGLAPATGRAFFDLYRGESGTQVIGAGFTNPTVGTGTAFVNSVLTDPSNATAANRSFVRINKGTVINTNTSTGTPSSSDPDAALTVGSSTGVDDDFFDGALAEILLYNTKLSDTDRDLNIDYLMNKWGIV